MSIEKATAGLEDSINQIMFPSMIFLSFCELRNNLRQKFFSTLIKTNFEVIIS